ncbi:MAG: hypothetical protein M3R53_06605 [Candidatus Eremiobacteraeota bacterium]|nr:hypothetical protein [Candidatus Eremiobacteraeota bacterium]
MFAGTSAAAAPSFVSSAPLRAGARLTTAQILDGYPTPVSGDVVQYELGFGAAYDKQIGFGHETNGNDLLFFVETQVGNGDHACNPNTLKKVYLKRRRFANVFTPYPASVYVTRSGSMMTRWGDGVGPSAADLLLLDTKLLYRSEPVTIHRLTREHLTVGKRKIAATHVTARYGSENGASPQRLDLWLSAEVPLGLVKMRASLPGLEPFELSLYAFGKTFKSSLAMKLATVRALTPSGGEIPVIQ